MPIDLIFRPYTCVVVSAKVFLNLTGHDTVIPRNFEDLSSMINYGFFRVVSVHITG
jgi:hypothetical protein